MKIQDKVFLETIETLERSIQEYWICNGTLLGIIRDRQLIPWDLEIDIGVLKENFSKENAKKAFLRNGFELHDYGKKSDHITFIKDKIRVDINIYVLRDDKYETLWRIPRYSIAERVINRLIRVFNSINLFKIQQMLAARFAIEGYSIPSDCLMPLISIEFLNKKVMIPKDSEKVLEWVYGVNWRIPKKDYDWRTEGANNSFG